MAYTALIKVVIGLTGLYISYHAAKAGRRRGYRSLWALSVGMAMVTIGCLVSGTLASDLGMDPVLDRNIGYTVVGAGLLGVIYSLRSSTI